MTRTNENETRLEAKAAWSVVVVYEDAAARARAVNYCDQLMARFWSRLQFEVSWCSFTLLGEPASAKETLDKAIRTDLLVVAAAPEGDFSPQVKLWIENWLRQRGECEGMLVGLLEAADGSPSPEGARHRLLRNAAQHGGVDYLTEVPHELSRTIPDSLDSYNSRAEQVTTLLDNILHQQPPPPSPLP
jgi:hypothetical protein